jgi:LysM repeat protein
MRKFPILEKLREFRSSFARRKSAAPPRRVTRLHATARRASAMDDYEDDQPTTKLSSAFIVVLVLHIVAVGGIFAFKGIKAHRQTREVPVASGVREQPAPARTASADSAAASRAANLPEATPIPLPQKIYRAHGGEALSRVAAQQGVSLTELAAHNGLNANTVLKPNQNVVIPVPKNAKTASQPATKPAIAATATPAANETDTKRQQFLVANQQQKDDKWLNSTTKAAPATSAKQTARPAAKTYTVAKNDTVTSIARKYGVSADALMKLNKITDAKKLQPNQTLQIPAK